MILELTGCSEMRTLFDFSYEVVKTEYLESIRLLPLNWWFIVFWTDRLEWFCSLDAYVDSDLFLGPSEPLLGNLTPFTGRTLFLKDVNWLFEGPWLDADLRPPL
jgi:hypothetical protein